ncbi:hypothetical protein ['Catharanthus roseus' aster yellows phytoplasma]|uniref:Immunodominant membrane protein n=1 Tax='Catharanthus roseus' aster yellows phytoplasma TaxID=1193712 RepID=A0A4P6MA91_9MOLU|nr:hypothetical protein ['Catharanthus roseus' aster yellows phytoplasma]QBF23744.1 hypothetical protein EXT02_00725 ['Catharanthus roseus' aster yellows phytoplasma]
MKFLATKRGKIITGIIFITVTLYLGLGFYISFNPVNWLSPKKVWAKQAAQNLYNSVEKLTKEENKGNVNSKLASIKTNLEAVNKHVIEYYKESTSNEYEVVKDLYEKIVKTKDDAYDYLKKNDNKADDTIFSNIKKLFKNDNAKNLQEKVNNLTN